jgi:hypothetical protein
MLKKLFTQGITLSLVVLSHERVVNLITSWVWSRLINQTIVNQCSSHYCIDDGRVVISGSYINWEPICENLLDNVQSASSMKSENDWKSHVFEHIGRTSFDVSDNRRPPIIPVIYALIYCCLIDKSRPNST